MIVLVAKIVLKRQFCIDTGEDSAHSFRSQGGRAFSQYNRFGGKIVLERTFFSDMGKIQVCCSGLRETEL